MKQGILIFLFFILLWHTPAIIREWHKVSLSKIEAKNRIDIINNIIDRKNKVFLKEMGN